MVLTRRELLKYFLAVIASIKINKELSVFAEHFYVRCPIILGHDMNLDREKSRFTSTITRAIANGYTPLSVDDLMIPLVSGLPLEIEKPFVMHKDEPKTTSLRV